MPFNKGVFIENELTMIVIEGSNDFELASEIILHNHEQWDGNGYQHQLKAEGIPLAARITTIVDSYDATKYD